MHCHNERRESRIDVEDGQAYHGRTRTQNEAGELDVFRGSFVSVAMEPMDPRSDDALRAFVRVLARQAARELLRVWG